VSDETGLLARPLRTLHVARVREAPEAVANAARLADVGAIVVGIPEGLEGQEARPETRRVLRFAKALRAATGMPVHFQDESLSSREARAIAGGRRGSKEAEHAQSAAVVLQRWLDDRGAASAAGGAGA
jgi:putative transcription antitermination factor YqgF